MDVNGVDVDFLNDNEIVELFNQIIDINSENLLIIKQNDNTDVSEDYIEEMYDNLLYKNQNTEIFDKNINELSDEGILALNGNIVDEDSTELKLINGYNVDVNNLTEEEILTLYDDYIDSDKVYLAASTKFTISSCQMYFASLYGTTSTIDCTLTNGTVVSNKSGCDEANPRPSYSCGILQYRVSVIKYNGSDYACYFTVIDGSLSYSSYKEASVFCYKGSSTYMFEYTASNNYWIMK